MTEKYYGCYDSPIGIIEITASDDAVLSIMFADSAKETDFKPEVLKKTIRQLDEYFRGTRRDFDIKYEMQGTEFQKRVWKALTEIPYGETMSYKEMAVKIGNEKAARAVGSANSKNAISIIVPCHRVIGSDKSLTGYAGGIDRKKWLIEHERRGFIGNIAKYNFYREK